MRLILPLRTVPLGSDTSRSVGSAAQTKLSRSTSKTSEVRAYRLPGILGVCKFNFGD